MTEAPEGREKSGSADAPRPRGRRISRWGGRASRGDWKRYVPVAAAGAAFVAIVCVRLVLVWGEKDPAGEWARRLPPEVPADDEGVVVANALYVRCLELMSHRKFDEAVEVVEQARAAHIRLMERFPYERYPQMKWVEEQERQLSNYERLLSERDTADELRAMALESQKRIREANLEKALEEARRLEAEGKCDEAVALLGDFAQRHEGFDVAGRAAEEAERISREATQGAR